MASTKLILKIFGIIDGPDHEIRLTNLKKPKLGELIPDENIIKISPLCRLQSGDGLPSSPAASLIHEILHVIYPNRPHKDINKLAKEVWRKLSPIQKLALYERLFEKK